MYTDVHIYRYVYIYTYIQICTNVNIYVCMYVCIQAAAARCGGAVRSTALQLQQYGEGSCGVTNLGAVTNLGTGVTNLGAGGSLPLHLLCQVKRTRFLYILLREYIYVPYYRIGYLTKRTRLYALL